MRKALGLSATALLAGAAVVAGLAGPAAADPRGEQALDSAVERQLRADGPFFTAEERAVIERACGYAAGEWDSFGVNMQRGALICADGRRVASPEVRAVIDRAAPRIEARVRRVMASPEVTEAIDRIASEATAEALREAETALANLDLDIDVDGALDLDSDVGSEEGRDEADD